MSLNEKEKMALWSGLRSFIYLLLAMCFIGFIHYLASIYKEQTFAENSIVENIQLSLLLISGIIFLIQGICIKDWRPLMLFLASLCFLASCRELDKTLDELIYGLRWRVGFVFPLIAFEYALKYKEITRQNLFSFLGSSSFYLMFSALIIIFPIAQCIGHRPLIVNVLGDNQMAATKELFEECSEVMGYFFIFLASIESYIGLTRKKS
ncbi:MAG: hypothetical protein NC218_06180 [Acetobacter sp.]|nr:hypothetical protein [Acetobacter sp.]